jgi:hypothetical protein
MIVGTAIMIEARDQHGYRTTTAVMSSPRTQGIAEDLGGHRPAGV